MFAMTIWLTKDVVGEYDYCEIYIDNVKVDTLTLYTMGPEMPLQVKGTYKHVGAAGSMFSVKIIKTTGIWAKSTTLIGIRDLSFHFINPDTVPAVSKTCVVTTDPALIVDLKESACKCKRGETQSLKGECVNCVKGCNLCVGPAENQCLRCNLLTVGSWNGNKYSCKATEFAHKDETCTATCPFPLIQNNTRCQNPCPQTHFYYQDGTCQESCPEIQQKTEFGVKYCYKPSEKFNTTFAEDLRL